MKAWLLALRPKTLPAALVPVWMGNLPLLHADNPETPFSWVLLVSTLLSCLCIQVATNLFNDAIDAEKGADTADRLGPQRVTASGLLSPKAVLCGALLFCLLAALVAIPLIQSRGWIIILIGVLSLLLSYGYTGGPWPLAYRGLGELFVLLFFGFVAVVGSYFVQAGRLPDGMVWLTACQVGFYSCVLIAINNLRDRLEDGKSGKRTLAVRWGVRFGRWEIALFCLGPVLFGIGAAFWGGWSRVWPALAVLPLGAIILRGVFGQEPGKVYNRYLALGGMQLLGFAVASSVAEWIR